MSDAINLTVTGLNMTQNAIPLVVTMVQQTNWTQFLISLFIGSIFLLFFFGQAAGLGIMNILGQIKLYSIKKMTHRHVVLIKHTQAALFSQSMIDQSTLRDIQKAMLKFGGKPFDIIFHTPGGEIFSTMQISRLLKTYPGEVRAIIPSMSMSGGTMLALSCNKLYMSPTATLGPSDPQIGSLFKFGSAAAWKKIVKFKGNKAEDSSISMEMIGSQYTKTIRNYLNEVVDFGLSSRQKQDFIKFITSGEVEHAYQLTPQILNNFGFTINKIPEEAQKVLLKLISSKGLEGVTYL